MNWNELLNRLQTVAESISVRLGDESAEAIELYQLINDIENSISPEYRDSDFDNE